MEEEKDNKFKWLAVAVLVLAVSLSAYFFKDAKFFKGFIGELDNSKDIFLNLKEYARTDISTPLPIKTNNKIIFKITSKEPVYFWSDKHSNKNVGNGEYGEWEIVKKEKPVEKPVEQPKIEEQKPVEKQPEPPAPKPKIKDAWVKAMCRQQPAVKDKPLHAVFVDTSTSNLQTPIDEWVWDFGDGGEKLTVKGEKDYENTENKGLTTTKGESAINYLKEVAHDYKVDGNYTTTLTVKNTDNEATDTYTCTKAITKTPPEVEPVEEKPQEPQQIVSDLTAKMDTTFSIQKESGIKIMENTLQIVNNIEPAFEKISQTEKDGKFIVKFEDKSVVDIPHDVTWKWNFGNNTKSEYTNKNKPSEITATYDSIGTYQVILTITDKNGKGYKAQKSINVYFVKSAFSAEFSQSSRSIEIKFMDYSIVEYTEIKNWEWDFGDGTKKTYTKDEVSKLSKTSDNHPIFIHSFEKSAHGNIFTTVKLTIKNSEGGESTSEKKYEISAAGIWEQTMSASSNFLASVFNLDKDLHEIPAYAISATEGDTVTFIPNCLSGKEVAHIQIPSVKKEVNLDILPDEKNCDSKEKISRKPLESVKETDKEPIVEKKIERNPTKPKETIEQKPTEQIKEQSQREEVIKEQEKTVEEPKRKIPKEEQKREEPVKKPENIAIEPIQDEPQRKTEDLIVETKEIQKPEIIVEKYNEIIKEKTNESCLTSVEPKDFMDVGPEDGKVAEVINTLASLAFGGKPIIVGYDRENGREFDKYATITRAEAGKIMLYATCLTQYLDIADATLTPPVFDDVKKGEWYYNIVGKLMESNLMKGYSDGTLRPNNPITKAEFVKMMLNIYKIINKDKTFDATDISLSQFADVSEDDWFKDVAMESFKAGIFKGYPDENEKYHFEPNRPISRQEAAIVIYNFFVSTVKAT